MKVPTRAHQMSARKRPLVHVMDEIGDLRVLRGSCWSLGELACDPQPQSSPARGEEVDITPPPLGGRKSALGQARDRSPPCRLIPCILS